MAQALPFTFKRNFPNRYLGQYENAPDQVAPQQVQPIAPAITNLPPLSGMDLTRAGGRPLPDSNISDQLTRQEDYSDQLGEYKPRKAGGWKRWLVPIALSALAGGANRGGLASAAGGAIVGALKGEFDPTEQDRNWKEREQAKTEHSIGNLTNRAFRKAQTANVQDEVRARQLKPSVDAATTARQEREKRIANLLTMHDRLGHYHPDDINDIPSQQIKQQAKELGVDAEFVPYDAKEKNETKPEIVAITNEDGTVTHFERQKDGNFVTAKGLPPSYPKAALTEDVSFGNAQIEQSVNEMQGERDKIGDYLKIVPKTVKKINGQGYEEEVENPEYKDQMGRYRDLDDKIRAAKMQMKAPKMLAPRGAKSRATEESIRAAAIEQHLDPDEAVKRAKARHIL